ncbi:hypothetical protein K488DRAFT_80634 [Vararia minispora EC-137]|uniref:Uncharacterized protein n=1 Tax=Vararia minispora EC-137 TaxID=1314806 RepID=A0ACB8QAC7_9AGAM|nr:hypothetical protein K488DRAFT_80634 [Vararia minispora EC-137]
MPSTDDFYRVVEQVENYVSISVSAAADEIPHIGEHIQRLWADVTRYGPKIPDIHLPSLGDFEVPPPPPPPPPPRTVWEKSADWVEEHPWTAAGLGAGIVVGATLLVGYGGHTAWGKKGRKHKASTGHRQVVVVLGADAPTGLPVVQEMERNGFIVIASCATADAASELEHRCKGYVRALVLDPTLPESVPNFIRLLVSALSRRFPINAPGDPHVSPASLPYVHSVVSLLGLYSPITVPSVPLERLHLQDDYLPYLTATHITPLTAIQALLPLLRTAPARARDNAANGRGRRSIVVCTPSVDALVGLPFAAARAMSAAATTRAVEVLRREVRMAAATGGAPAMKYLNVVTLDVGAIETPPPRARLIGYTSEADLDGWSESERAAYGAAYVAMVEQGPSVTRRRPTSARAFAESVVEVVMYGHKQTVSVFGHALPLGPLAKWVFGWRYPVGAGALTYTLASSLPQLLLDALLNLPYLIIAARNAMLPVPPPPITMPKDVPVERHPDASTFAPPPPTSDHESEAGSDADVESNASSQEHGDIKRSWVSLGSSTMTNPWKGPH